MNKSIDDFDPEATTEEGTIPYVPSAPKKKLNPNITKANPDGIIGRRIVGGGGKAGRPKPRV